VSASFSLKKSTKKRVFELQDELKENLGISLSASTQIEEFILNEIIPYYEYCLKNSFIHFKQFKEVKA
jgi:hypothetical protein